MICSSTTIHVEGIGDVIFRHSSVAKHVRISIQPFRDMEVTVPRFTPLRSAKHIVLSKMKWIHDQSRRVKQLESKVREMKVKTPDIDRKAARNILVHRLDKLASKHGFTYNRVFIRRQKTRWGSCSTRNNINLNINLIHLPPHLMDHVILHELIHTRVKNHGTQFRTGLSQIIGGKAEFIRQRNELKSYAYLLYL